MTEKPSIFMFPVSLHGRRQIFIFFNLSNLIIFTSGRVVACNKYPQHYYYYLTRCITPQSTAAMHIIYTALQIFSQWL